MPKINLLSKEVSELIAAGEVIERPASIVKELLENSIDAGATAVTVEIKRGGVSYIRVTDNGCGISREDAPVAFLRHATSKVKDQDDLAQIGTLGFRGEALASICAVARVELLTKRQEDAFGTRVAMEGGVQTDCSEAGCPNGTTLIVRDLFYNVPARLKFMKKDVSEGNAIASIVEKIALGHPEVSVRMIRDNKTTLHSSGDGDLWGSIYAVFGKEFAQGLMPVEYELNGIGVRGFASQPMKARANRSMQHFFINGRYVKSRIAMVALEEGYKNAMMVGKFPACVLNLTLPYSQVDVNVHPAKTEVRFVNERPVFDAVYFGIKSALSRQDTLGKEPAPQPRPAPAFSPQQGEQAVLSALGTSHGPKTPDASVAVRPNPPELPLKQREEVSKRASATMGISQEDSVGEEPRPIFSIRDALGVKRIADSSKALYHAGPQEETFQYIGRSSAKTPEPAKATAPEKAGEEPIGQEPALKAEAQPAGMEQIPPASAEFRVIGELFRTYILVQCGDEFVMIDKHAAHERMVFEKLKSENRALDRQVLLTPQPVTLSKEEYETALERQDIFLKLGFSLENFGKSTLLVREVPVILEGQDPAQMVSEIAANIHSLKKNPEPQMLEDLYHSIACKSAIKAHDETTPEELALLAQEVFENPEIRYCPHGRPVAITMTKREIEKKFGRLQ